jgi:hypothetical protein
MHNIKITVSEMKYWDILTKQSEVFSCSYITRITMCYVMKIISCSITILVDEVMNK